VRGLMKESVDNHDVACLHGTQYITQPLALGWRQRGRGGRATDESSAVMAGPTPQLTDDLTSIWS
jgi:hypothetical protein